MHLTKNGITIEVADDEIVQMVLQRLNGSTSPATLRGISVPKIGEVWPGQGGIYAGIARGRGGSPDYHLILAEAALGDELTWKAAGDAASAIRVDGLSDFELPRRAEQALLFANLKENFEGTYYWSCEEVASDPACAWCQDFDGGDQCWHHKGLELRARAVRRLPI